MSHGYNTYRITGPRGTYEITKTGSAPETKFVVRHTTQDELEFTFDSFSEALKHATGK